MTSEESSLLYTFLVYSHFYPPIETKHIYKNRFKIEEIYRIFLRAINNTLYSDTLIYLRVRILFILFSFLFLLLALDLYEYPEKIKKNEDNNCIRRLMQNSGKGMVENEREKKENGDRERERDEEEKEGKREK